MERASVSDPALEKSEALDGCDWPLVADGRPNCLYLAADEEGGNGHILGRRKRAGLDDIGFLLCTTIAGATLVAGAQSTKVLCCAAL